MKIQGMAKGKGLGVICVIAILVLALIAAFFLKGKSKWDDKEPEVITISTLEKIIDVDELSTFTAVYNGVAQVMNKQKPEETDYYVSYEAKVNAGINFEEIKITMDEETKEINIDIPNVHITDINVDIASLDFIFYNKKANTSSVTQEAFRACEEDVRRESEAQDAIFELAQQNAVNILTALTKPLVDQFAAEYTIVMQ